MLSSWRPYQGSPGAGRRDQQSTGAPGCRCERSGQKPARPGGTEDQRGRRTSRPSPEGASPSVHSHLALVPSSAEYWRTPAPSSPSPQWNPCTCRPPLLSRCPTDVAAIQAQAAPSQHPCDTCTGVAKVSPLTGPQLLMSLRPPLIVVTLVKATDTCAVLPATPQPQPQTPALPSPPPVYLLSQFFCHWGQTTVLAGLPPAPPAPLQAILHPALARTM